MYNMYVGIKEPNAVVYYVYGCGAVDVNNPRPKLFNLPSILYVSCIKQL